MYLIIQQIFNCNGTIKKIKINLNVMLVGQTIQRIMILLRTINKWKVDTIEFHLTDGKGNEFNMKHCCYHQKFYHDKM